MIGMLGKVVFASALVFPWAVSADVYICIAPDGVPAAQDFPCEKGSQQLAGPAPEPEPIKPDTVEPSEEVQLSEPTGDEPSGLGYVEHFCPPIIERMAKYDFEWTEGILGFKFRPRHLKSDKPNTRVFVGDSLKLQNGFGAWQNVIYYCEIHMPTKQITDVIVKPGRL